jgi:uncharacterized zinc-type alcohol dehydrogenase-like protein
MEEFDISLFIFHSRASRWEKEVSMISHSTVKGYAAMVKGGQLEPFTYPSPELGELEIRVSVTHCGLCYTDIQGIDDYFKITKFPFVPGHEIVGLISEVGRAVSDLKMGDRVGIGWQGRSCNHCEWCLREEEQLCLDIAAMGTWSPYGGFSSSVIVDHRFAYRLPGPMSSEDAAVLMCAGVSVFSPLQSYRTHAPQKIGIVGVGGLGHLAIQYAHALGYEVTAISSTIDKRDQALAFGADHFLDSGEEENLYQKQYDLDLLLCTVHDRLNWIPLMDTLKKKGRFILVGFPTLEFNTTDLVAHQLSFTGSFLGSRSTMREMLAFSQANNIKPVLEIMPLSQVVAAIQKVKDNKARYRVVLVNDLDPA